MQIKIISDQMSYQSTDSIAKYVGDAGKPKLFAFNENPSIQEKVNDFCKEHDVVNVIPSVAIIGNNPPTATIIYTIVYNE